MDLSSLGSDGGLGDNSYNFSTGLGSVDSSGGLNSLNAGLMGAGAGTMPNGYVASGSNYVPDGSDISAGALNGDNSFSMPANSTGQLNAQTLGNGLAAGSKLAGGSGSQQQQRVAPGHIAMHQVQFSSPIQNFAGSNGSSKMGEGILQLLSKYRPGSQ